MLLAHHAGPKMGVGRFQLGFFKVLYLQQRSCLRAAFLPETPLNCKWLRAEAVVTVSTDAHHTRTLSAVVAETIEPATRGIARAMACRCIGQQHGQAYETSGKMRRNPRYQYTRPSFRSASLRVRKGISVSPPPLTHQPYAAPPSLQCKRHARREREAYELLFLPLVIPEQNKGLAGRPASRPS